jgi:nicotinate phosphoribosyltransferase
MQLVMKQGKRLYPTESLTEIAERTAQSVASLSSETRCLNQPISPTIQISSALQKLTATTRH